MNEPISYTPEELAKLLKISKLTVYDLIKKGELLSYRVGKQMRVDAADLEAYKMKAKGVSASKPDAEPYASLDFERAAAPASIRQLVITGQDISLDLLAKHLEQQYSGSGIRALRAYGGSMDSLIAMYKGEADIVSTHLLDGDTQTYNIPYIGKLLNGFPVIVVHLLTRAAGLFVQLNNPRQLHGWSDLAQPGLRLVNREKGSGARVLLDEQLRLHGINGRSILGYESELTSHLAVAGAVMSGEADVGVGHEKAASLVGVEFIPLVRESYDLVMLATEQNRDWIECVLRIIGSQSYQSELRSIGGFDLSRCGEVVWRS